MQESLYVDLSRPAGSNPFTSAGAVATPAPVPVKATVASSVGEVNPFKSSASTAGSNPFGSPAPAAPKPFKQSIEPKVGGSI